MRISDWSSDVCSSGLSDATIATAMAFARRIGKVAVLAGNSDGFIGNRILRVYGREADFLLEEGATPWQVDDALKAFGFPMGIYLMRDMARSEEHTSELQSLMRISYAVFCLKKKKTDIIRRIKSANES